MSQSVCLERSIPIGRFGELQSSALIFFERGQHDFFSLKSCRFTCLLSQFFPAWDSRPSFDSPLQSSSIRCRDGFDASMVVFGLGEGVLRGGYEDFVALPFFVLFFPTARFFLDRFLFEFNGVVSYAKEVHCGFTQSSFVGLQANTSFNGFEFKNDEE
ncbi:hypothetical protein KSP39_PZI001879 [Platanthera zijinensis]|uniref:Uncharacterized protein n=1 Tax=Platanthera zijinensis TaxID=2320716 RepID=A0AAP0GEF1_9ASPA